MGQVHVVVLQERHPSLELRIPGELVDALEDFLARIVRGMGLARKDDLNRTPGIYQQAAKPVDIAKDQVGSLVGREAAAEPDGERHGIEQGSGTDDLGSLLQLSGKPASRVLA